MCPLIRRDDIGYFNYSEKKFCLMFLENAYDIPYCRIRNSHVPTVFHYSKQISILGRLRFKINAPAFRFISVPIFNCSADCPIRPELKYLCLEDSLEHTDDRAN